MSRCEWIVCERSGRWAATLRMALGRQTTASDPLPRLHEVRSLGELTARLDARPSSLGLIEVHYGNLGAALAWLAEAVRRCPQARFVALLDHSLVHFQETMASSRHDDRHNVRDALLEAGAADVAHSPRHLQGVLALGRRQAAFQSGHHVAPTEEESFEAWAWASLPWQAE